MGIITEKLMKGLGIPSLEVSGGSGGGAGQSSGQRLPDSPCGGFGVGGIQALGYWVLGMHSSYSSQCQGH